MTTAARDAELVAAEEHAISMRVYFRDELVPMLGRAGFDDEFLVYIAARPEVV